MSPPSAGFFMGERLDFSDPTEVQEGITMATKKKPAAKKKPADKKTGFYPKVKSTKKNGLGSY